MPGIILLKKVLLPPTSLVLTALMALAALSSGFLSPGVAEAVLWPAVGGLYLCGLSTVGFRLLRTLERYPAYDPTPDFGGDFENTADDSPAIDRTEAARAARADRADRAQAIVVLDAGRYARGRGPEAVKPETLDRLQHGVWQQRRTGLPILVSGDGAGALMDTVLRELFGTSARWIEATSRNTQENADFSAAMLRAEGVDHVMVVTHGWHMPRSVAAFERAGLRVTPAPMGFGGPDRWELRLLSLVPTATGWLATHIALHEWVGIGWYRLRYGWRDASASTGPSSIGPPKSSSTNTVA